jgi:hypothetical protein
MCVDFGVLFIFGMPAHPSKRPILAYIRVLKLYKIKRGSYPREAAPNSSCTQKSGSSSKFRFLHPSGPPGGFTF